MPEGVEHAQIIGPTVGQTCKVPLAVMPEGVEHELWQREGVTPSQSPSP